MDHFEHKQGPLKLKTSLNGLLLGLDFFTDESLCPKEQTGGCDSLIEKF